VTSPESIRLAALTLALAHRRSLDMCASFCCIAQRNDVVHARLDADRDIEQLDPDGSLREQLRVSFQQAGVTGR